MTFSYRSWSAHVNSPDHRMYTLRVTEVVPGPAQGADSGLWARTNEISVKSLQRGRCTAKTGVEVTLGLGTVTGYSHATKTPWRAARSKGLAPASARTSWSRGLLSGMRRLVTSDSERGRHLVDIRHERLLFRSRE